MPGWLHGVQTWAAVSPCILPHHVTRELTASHGCFWSSREHNTRNSEGEAAVREAAEAACNQGLVPRVLTHPVDLLAREQDVAEQRAADG
jgi:hypothetical protein